MGRDNGLLRRLLESRLTAEGQSIDKMTLKSGARRPRGVEPHVSPDGQAQGKENAFATAQFFAADAAPSPPTKSAHNTDAFRPFTAHRVLNGLFD